MFTCPLFYVIRIPPTYPKLDPVMFINVIAFYLLLSHRNECRTNSHLFFLLVPRCTTSGYWYQESDRGVQAQHPTDSGAAQSRHAQPPLGDADGRAEAAGASQEGPDLQEVLGDGLRQTYRQDFQGIISTINSYSPWPNHTDLFFFNFFVPSFFYIVN